MENLEEKSNNELLFYSKQLQADHEALKIKMIKDYDNLVEIEKTYSRVIEIVYKRLNPS